MSIAGKLGNAMNALFSTSGYDAVKTSSPKKRRALKSIVKNFDKELSAKDRRTLSWSVRDIYRNFETVGWAIRRHLDYVASYSFQVRTDNPTLNTQLERLIGQWSKKCDVSGRHSLRRMIRILETCRLFDGDALLVKTRTGLLQGIEGDRIASYFPQGFKADSERWVHGIEVDRQLRYKRFSVCNRNDSGQLSHSNFIKAEHAILHANYTEFNQVRGVTELASAINSFCDLYESIGYALNKAKIAQLFGLIFYRDASEMPDTGGEEDEIDDETGEVIPKESQEDEGYDLDLTKGPFTLDLEAGDKAEFLENKTPPVEFQQFCQEVMSAALKSLDIPYSFYDESFTNYSGQRHAWLLYDKAAKEKQHEIVNILDDITHWRIVLAILNDELRLPAGMSLDDIIWEWIPTGVPWVNPLVEVKADDLAVKAGFTSQQRVCKSHGLDFWEIVAEQKEAAQAIKEINELKGINNATETTTDKTSAA